MKHAKQWQIPSSIVRLYILYFSGPDVFWCVFSCIILHNSACVCLSIYCVMATETPEFLFGINKVSIYLFLVRTTRDGWQKGEKMGLLGRWRMSVKRLPHNSNYFINPAVWCRWTAYWFIVFVDMWCCGVENEFQSSSRRISNSQIPESRTTALH